MEIEACDEEEAYVKACHILGLCPMLQKALQHTLEAAELFQRCADTAKEGAEVGHFISAVACLKHLANELTPDEPPDTYSDNIIPFSERYRRPKHGRRRLSSTTESDQET